MKKIFLISCVITFAAFLSFLPTILQNKVIFKTDEMYWIQTGRMLTLISKFQFRDHYWNEHMGFTNFNGAKWIYALGLRLFGHTDFSTINYPPTHIDEFKSQDNKNFSTTETHYPFVLHGRLISAFFASISIGLIFSVAILIFNFQYSAAILTIALLRIHPTIIYIATHALADSMLLSAQICSLLIMTLIVYHKFHVHIYVQILLGIVLGYSAAIKINGAMFTVLYISTICISMYYLPLSLLKITRQFIFVTLIAIYTFIFLHPNFFFFTDYTFSNMIQDRIHITAYHMEYFSQVNPPHVLHTISSRLLALYKNVFTPYLIILFLIGCVFQIFLFVRNKERILNLYIAMMCVHILIIVDFLLLYAVFNDRRYFLPLLPYICLIASCWIPQASYSIGKFVRKNVKNGHFL